MGESDAVHAAGESLRRVTEKRDCPYCGYDLRGQDVVREERYGWLVVRCVECGRFVPLGVDIGSRRMRGWGTASAGAVWVLLAVGLYIGLGSSLFAVALGSVEVSTFARDGASASGERFAYALWSLPVSAGFALPLAVLLCGLSTWRLVLAPLAVAPVVAVFWLIESIGYSSTMVEHTSASVDTTVVVLALSTLPFLVARPLLRAVVGLMLPAWASAGLPELWTRDGKAPPKFRGG